MVWIAILSLILGVAAGQLLLFPDTVSGLSNMSEYVLYLLMLSVGVSVGRNKEVFQKIKEYNIKILIIPLGITIGSIIGGFVCGLIFDMRMNAAVSIASGMGWYSLTGVLLSDLAGAEIGTIGFLSNLLREIISFMSIPFVARRFNHYTAIAPAAATSEDTTLPMLVKYTSGDVVLISVFNGFICSTLVPILIKFFYAVL